MKQKMVLEGVDPPLEPSGLDSSNFFFYLSSDILTHTFYSLYNLTAYSKRNLVRAVCGLRKAPTMLAQTYT